MYGQFAPQGQAFNLANTEALRVLDAWSNEVIRYRREKLLIGQGVQRFSWSGTKRSGDTIHIPRVGRLGVNPKVSGAPVKFQSRTETDWTMVIDQYKESSFSIEQIVDLRDPRIRSFYTDEASRALAEDIEHTLLAQRAALNGWNNADHIDSASPLTFADIMAAWELLNIRNVPREGRMLFISPQQESTMFTGITEFIKDGVPYAEDIANLKNGRIGTILGMPVYVSNNITRNSATGLTLADGSTVPTPGFTGSPYYPNQQAEGDDGVAVTPTSLPVDKYTAMMVNPEWCRLAWQKMPSVDADWSTEYQEWHVVQTQIYAAKVYRPDAAVLISTDEDGLVA